MNIIVKTAKQHTDLLNDPYTRQLNFAERRKTIYSQIKLKLNSFLLTKTCKKVWLVARKNKGFQLSRNVRLSWLSGLNYDKVESYLQMFLNSDYLCDSQQSVLLSWFKDFRELLILQRKIDFIALLTRKPSLPNILTSLVGCVLRAAS